MNSKEREKAAVSQRRDEQICWDSFSSVGIHDSQRVVGPVQLHRGLRLVNILGKPNPDPEIRKRQLREEQLECDEHSILNGASE